MRYKPQFMKVNEFRVHQLLRMLRKLDEGQPLNPPEPRKNPPPPTPIRPPQNPPEE